MTGTEVDVETQAHQLAARGREVLVERMRAAYSDAAAAQADLITLDDERIESMVQSAADRADGLQWRRALAAVAAEAFGISPTEALSHPAVTRAQSLVGAPSYEQSLAEMIARPVPAAEAAPIAAPVERILYVDEPSDELETVEADDVVLELLPEPDPGEYEPEYETEPSGYQSEPAEAEAEAGAKPVETASQPVEPASQPVEPALRPVDHETQAYDVEASFVEDPMPAAPTNPFAVHAATQAEAAAPEPVAPEPVAAESVAAEPMPSESEPEPKPAPEEENVEVSFAAVHLGGVANLPTKKEGLSVRLSADGLDIMQGPRDIIGRLVWDEIEALEVPALRMRRRQKTLRARLVVRTPHGDASFEVPEVTTDELREQVEPLMRLYGGH